MLYLCHLVLHRGYHLLCILTFAHHNDALYHIVIAATAHLSEPRSTRLMHTGQVAHQDRSAVDVFHHNVSYLVYIIDKSYATHRIRLSVALYDVATHIHIRAGYGLIEF